MFQLATHGKNFTMTHSVIQLDDTCVRAVCALPSHSQSPRYLVGGSCSVSTVVHKDGDVSIESIRKVDEPVWKLNSLVDPDRVLVTSARGASHAVTILCLSDESLSIEITSATFVSAVEAFSDTIAVVTPEDINIFSGTKQELSIPNPQGGALAFLSESVIASNSSRCLRLLDLRACKPVTEKRSAHLFEISAISADTSDRIVTGCQEGLLKFWDARNLHAPLLTLSGGHNHWVTALRLNPASSRYCLSAGTDCCVNLWQTPSLMTASRLPMDGIVEGGKNVHADSVYDICWSGPGSFASVSFDGTVAAWSVALEI